MSHDEGWVCECVAEHRPAPLELALHRLLPGQYGGTYAEDNVVPLCPTTHANVHELVRLMLRPSAKPWTEHDLRKLYDQPLSRYAYKIAAEGVHRIRERQ